MTISKSQRAAILAYLSDAFGAERIRINRLGEVHAYGRMPNSIVTGWYFASFAETILARIAESNAA